DGGVFPAGLLIGQVAQDPSGRLRVRLAADFERLEFLRVLRHHGTGPISGPGGIVSTGSIPPDMPVAEEAPADG
ncbi:MAG: rod shape-determining protein MreC, partial [Pseudomonadota bacterium]